MNEVTKKLEAYHFRVFYKSASLVNNINVELENVKVYRDEDGKGLTIPILDFDYDIASAGGGFYINYYVLTETEDEMQDFMYLSGEDFEISKLDGTVSNGNGKIYNDYYICTEIGEMVLHPFPVRLSPEMEKSMEFLGEQLSDNCSVSREEIFNKMFETINNDDKLLSTIYTMASI